MDLTRDVLAGALVVVGVGIELLCCLALLVIDDVYDRLHYLGPAGTLGPLFIALAIAVQRGYSIASSKALFVALIMAATGPIVTHALARAARVRQFEHWTALPEEVTDR